MTTLKVMVEIRTLKYIFMLLQANSRKFWVAPCKLPVVVQRWNDTSFPDPFKHQTNLDQKGQYFQVRCPVGSTQRVNIYFITLFTLQNGMGFTGPC